MHYHESEVLYRRFSVGDSHEGEERSIAAWRCESCASQGPLLCLHQNVGVSSGGPGQQDRQYHSHTALHVTETCDKAMRVDFVRV
jgi:hypothetical protein